MTIPHIDRLRAKADVAISIPNAQSVIGWQGKTSFVVIGHEDGHVEASLSRDGTRHPTDSQARKFFDFWGIQPITEMKAGVNCRIYLIQRARNARLH